eukprot:Opistho-2@49552
MLCSRKCIFTASRIATATKNQRISRESQRLIREMGAALAMVASSAPRQPQNVRTYATQRVLTLESINQHLRNAEYAVRGEVPMRAEQIASELRDKKGSFPFDKIVRCNIGNPQELGQRPLTFFRQVCALLDCPDLLLKKNRETVLRLFPADAIDRAIKLQHEIPSTGAYSHSQGIKAIRDNVAKFIEERDGYPSSAEDIYLTNGASGGVQAVLQLIIQNERSGVMIPIPQYPLYSATLALFNGAPVPYYLNEDKGWGLTVDELQRSLNAARSAGIDTRALVIINPGNPTGGLLEADNIKDIIQFCHRERLVILADEVYQTNVYDPSLSFQSFKKVLKSMGPTYEDVELFSFHSISKGFVGECGKRGGFMEIVGVDQEVRDQIYKNASISLCPNIHGQVLVDLMVRPPQKGEASYELYNSEKNGILQSLKSRAETLVAAFNKLEGVTCNPAQGAMYTFPRIRLSKKAVEAAQAAGKRPDSFYSLALLNATGVCVVPGSGFNQVEGTWHFRSTFLPPEDQFPTFIDNIARFHKSFMDKYRD